MAYIRNRNRNRNRKLASLFLFLFLFLFLSCVRKPKQRYSLAIIWNNTIELTQNNYGICTGGYGSGDPHFFTSVRSVEYYKNKCWLVLEKEIDDHGDFQIIRDSSEADIVVEVNACDISETISIQSPNDINPGAGNSCYYLHSISASYKITVYYKGMIIGVVDKDNSKSQDLKSNSKNTSYSISNTLFDHESVMKGASKSAGEAVVNRISRFERKSAKAFERAKK